MHTMVQPTPCMILEVFPQEQTRSPWQIHHFFPCLPAHTQLS